MDQFMIAVDTAGTLISLHEIRYGDVVVLSLVKAATKKSPQMRWLIFVRHQLRIGLQLAHASIRCTWQLLLLLLKMLWQRKRVIKRRT